jgi:regulatory protein
VDKRREHQLVFMGKTPLTPEKIWTRIRHFCQYRERCHYEVREKLYAMGLFKNQVEPLISKLIEEDLLSEERFARSFARGHFRVKGWGRIKIIYFLRQKKISEPLIKIALREIESVDYDASLYKFAAFKWKMLTGEHLLTRQAKTRAYLLQKGYEEPAIRAALKKIQESSDR